MSKLVQLQDEGSDYVYTSNVNCVVLNTGSLAEGSVIDTGILANRNTFAGIAFLFQQSSQPITINFGQRHSTSPIVADKQGYITTINNHIGVVVKNTSSADRYVIFYLIT